MTEQDRSASLSTGKRVDSQAGVGGPAASTGTLSGSTKRSGNRRRTQNRKTRNGRRSGALYAALDLGTNNCRLLIARPTDNGIRVVDGFSRIVRLGEGVSSSGKLSQSAMDRTFDALAACKARLDAHDIKRKRLIATEACRAAGNAAAFLGKIESQLGLNLEVIDRKTEAELAVTGCADLVEPKATGAILFDIGGGSSELAWLDFRGGRPKSRGKMAAAIRSWQSLPVGVVSIAEKFGGKDVTPELFEEMIEHVRAHLRHFRGREKLRAAMAEQSMHLVGTSGTVTTLAGLHLGLERYDRSKVDGLWMQGSHVVDTMRVLLSMSYDRRSGHGCIGRERADLVIPGCAIFEAIRREWPCERIRVADRGLREGMLISLMAEDRVWSRAGAQRRRRPKPEGGHHGL